MTDPETYLTPEAKARLKIDEMLVAAGWAVQDANRVNLSAKRGVAVREFVLEPPHGSVDYLLFVDGEAVGVIEAKTEGTTLTGVESQNAKYAEDSGRRSRRRSSRSRSPTSRPGSRRASRTASIPTRAAAQVFSFPPPRDARRLGR